MPEETGNIDEQRPEEPADRDDQDTPPQDETDTHDEEAPAGAGGMAEVLAEPAEDEEQVKCDVEVEDAGTLRKKVVVTVPRESIDAKFDEMFGELSESAQVPGFRIGRAPRRLVEKRFGREVGRDVRNAVIGESLGQALEQTELKTLGEPDIDLDAIELPDSGDMSYSFEIEVQPEFDLPELDGISVTKPDIEITDERVNEFIENLRGQRARHEDTDEPAAEGDTVVAGAKITGEGLEPVEKHGLTLRVAPGQVEGLPLMDLGKGLAGKKAGDTATLTVTAPASHPNEDWQGKELTVELSVGQVKRRVLPELNDEFAENVGFDSLDELREYVQGQMQSQAAVETRRAQRDQICNYVLENTDFELPEGVVNRHTARVLQRRYVDLLYQGVPRERIDENLTELQASSSEQAQRDLRLRFILGKIADDREIEVTPDEINARVAQMASAYGRRPERLRQELAQDGTLEQVESAIREEKVLDELLSQAKVTEGEPSGEDKPDQSEKESGE